MAGKVGKKTVGVALGFFFFFFSMGKGKGKGKGILFITGSRPGIAEELGMGMGFDVGGYGM